MYTRSGLLLVILLDMRLLGDSIYTTELRRPAAQASLVSFPSSSSPSIRTWDQLNGETLAGKTSHREGERIDRVRGYRLD